MPESDIAAHVRPTAVAAAEAIYRITEPATLDPALKFVLRRKATEIVSAAAGVGLRSGRQRLAALEELSSTIAAAGELIRFGRRAGEIRAEHAERILGAYERMAGEVQLLVEGFSRGNGAGTVGRTEADPKNGRGLNGRQQRVLEFLNTNGSAQIGQIRDRFGRECSEKTLQRDLWQLVGAGLIRRQGDYRWTTYIAIGH